MDHDLVLTGNSAPGDSALTDAALATALARHAHAARGAYAANTERALRADMHQAVNTAVADNVSTSRSPLSANLSTKSLRLRARAWMIASAYTYEPDWAPPQAILAPPCPIS
jgi:hypothetical protein